MYTPLYIYIYVNIHKLLIIGHNSTWQIIFRTMISLWTVTPTVNMLIFEFHWKILHIGMLAVFRADHKNSHGRSKQM